MSQHFENIFKIQNFTKHIIINHVRNFNKISDKHNKIINYSKLNKKDLIQVIINSPYLMDFIFPSDQPLIMCDLCCENKKIYNFYSCNTCRHEFCKDCFFKIINPQFLYSKCKYTMDRNFFFGNVNYTYSKYKCPFCRSNCNIQDEINKIIKNKRKQYMIQLFLNLKRK